MSSNLAERAYRALENSMVSLRVSSPSKRVACNVYTGFVIELNGHWAWITAAHVFETVAEDKARFPDLKYQWKPWASQSNKWCAIPYDKFQKVDIGKDLVELSMAEGDSCEKTEVYKSVDLGYILIDGYWQAILTNLGVKPFPGRKAALTNEEFARVCEGGWCAFVAGCPQESHTYLASENASQIKHAVEPLTMLSAQGLVFRLQRTAESKSAKSMKGFSGGPVVALAGEELYLIGVQYFQEEGHEIVRAVNTMPIFRPMVSDVSDQPP
jgi:hypothetical protein